MTNDDILKAIFSEEEKKKENEQWKDRLIRDTKGNIRNIPANYEIFLTQHPKYSGKLKYNDLIQRKEFNGECWNDFMLNTLYNDCEREMEIGTRTKIDSMLYEVFDKNRYNPVLDYLNDCSWDGKERISRLFIDLLEADDTELNKRLTEKWFLAAIKRIVKPGCKFDNMIILQGGQGIGKSTICEKIALSMANTISLDEIQSKDIVDKMNKSWILIIDEMDAFKKGELSKIKTFISTSKDSARLAYGRETMEYYRHCVFIGSTNDDTFLRDTTSSVERRFWVIKCNKMTRDSKVYNTLTDDYIRQLWGEAYHKYKENPEVYLDLEEDLQQDFSDEQQQFNIQNDDDFFDYFDSVVNHKYKLDNKGEFISDNDFLRQATEVNSYSDGVSSYINKIPVSWLNMVIEKKYNTKRGRKHIEKGLNGEWEYKPARYNGKLMKCWVRKEEKSLKNDESYPIDEVLPF